MNFYQFIVNIALLVLVSALHPLLNSTVTKSKWNKNIFNGLFFGLAAIIAMLAPVKTVGGLFFDSRTVILSIGGLFGGWQAAILSILLAGSYRAIIGGGGMLTGVLTVILSSLMGIFFREAIKNNKLNLNGTSLYLFGLFTHVITLFLFIGMPNSININFLFKFGLVIPYIILMPIATFLIGSIILAEEESLTRQMETHETKKLLETTFNNLPDALFIIKSGTRNILDCNHAVFPIFGYYPEELIGNSTEMLHVDNYSFNQFNEIGIPELQKHNRFQTEYPMKRKNGTIFPAEVTVTVATNKKGEWVNVVSTVRDITGKKEQLERLELQSKMLSSVGEGVIAINTNEQIIYWNKAAEEMFGWKKEEIEGRYVRELLVLPEYQKAAGEVLDSLTKGNSWQDEIPMIKKNGWIFYSYTTSTPIFDAKGRLLGTIAIVRDITQVVKTRHDLEQQTLQLRAMAQNLSNLQEQERKNITRELHDEVGQMLAALGVNLSVLSENVDEEGTERLEDTLSLVENINDRIRHLMEDLRPSILDNYGLTAGLAWYFSRFTERTGIHVDSTLVDVGQRLPDQVKVAIFRIAQEVFTNIIKHSQAKNVKVSFKIIGHKLILEIEDDGIGFIKTEPSLHGLGLIHITERADAIGADLDISSKPGEGTRVTVKIPQEILK